MSPYVFRTFPPTCAALDGSDSRVGSRRRVGPPVACYHVSLFFFLRAAFLYGTHVAVAPHTETAGHGQIQGIHCLGLHLAEHRLAHCLNLPIHLNFTDLQMRGNAKISSMWTQTSSRTNMTWNYTINVRDSGKWIICYGGKRIKLVVTKLHQ